MLKRRREQIAKEKAEEKQQEIDSLPIVIIKKKMIQADPVYGYYVPPNMNNTATRKHVYDLLDNQIDMDRNIRILQINYREMRKKMATVLNEFELMKIHVGNMEKEIEKKLNNQN